MNFHFIINIFKKINKKIWSINFSSGKGPDLLSIGCLLTLSNGSHITCVFTQVFKGKI
jgi:hypothetical protein